MTTTETNKMTATPDVFAWGMMIVAQRIKTPEDQLSWQKDIVAALEGAYNAGAAGKADLLEACKAVMNFVHAANTTEGDTVYNMLCTAIARAESTT